ncbi:MarR family winged helix-turn-helix transcriptional regulator [Clostridium amazonitimonense]|uniref:MarR family winged helix-turn-helix transcriptional regulator n=1 Tax=Clostridium amazonitimonense TaxID=1499689 RepID=UPI000509C248|nr:MarR family transcriptional regulator [Clostridium amazonitimonense]
MNNREVAKVIIDFYLDVRKYIRSKKSEQDNGITEQRFRTLARLQENGKSTLKKLSSDMHVSNSSICIMLNKMVEDDLVTRESDEKDRRNTLYSLTNEGEKFLKEQREKRFEQVQEALDKLTEKQKQTLVDSLTNLKDIITIINSQD